MIHNKSFISKSLSEYAVLYCYDILSDYELNFLAKNINWQQVPDSEISNKRELIKKLDWTSFVDRMQILRISVRDLSNIDLYPLNKFEYEADEIMKSAKIEPTILDRVLIKPGSLRQRHIIEIAKIHPGFMNRINFNDDNLTQDECMEIAKMGVDSILDVFDFSSLKDIDKMKIIKAHLFSEKSLEKMGVFEEDFDNKFYIREILLNTNTLYINKLNISVLMPSDWVLLLKHNSCFKEFIPIEDFLICDPFYLVELCILCPEYIDFLNNDNTSRITSFGWENLFVNIRNNDKLINLCNFDLLEERTWDVFKEKRPDLLLFMN